MRRGKQEIEFFNTEPIAMAERLEALAADLRRLSSGHAPSPADLAIAPKLRHWGVFSRSAMALIGNVEGHPRIGDDRRVVTSEIYALDTNGTWARTMNRYYRLVPANQEDSND